MNREFLVELRGRGSRVNADGLSVLLFSEWEKYIREYCFQGGYGHSFNFQYGGITSPHHWCVKPQHIDQVLERITDCIRNLILSSDGSLTINREPAHEHWST